MANMFCSNSLKSWTPKRIINLHRSLQICSPWQTNLLAITRTEVLAKRIRRHKCSDLAERQKGGKPFDTKLKRYPKSTSVPPTFIAHLFQVGPLKSVCRFVPPCFPPQKRTHMAFPEFAFEKMTRNTLHASLQAQGSALYILYVVY